MRAASFFCIVFYLVAPLAAGAQQLVRHANAFLQVGVEASHEALGRTLGAEDYHPGQERVNPATVATIGPRYSFGGAYTSQFGGMAQLGAASFAVGLDSVSGLGFHFVRLSVPDIPNTLSWRDDKGLTDYNRITRFSVADYALFAAYGRQLYHWLSVGGCVKAIYRHEGGFARGYGMGFDIGATYMHPRWRAAAVLHDVTTTWTFWVIHPSRLGRTVGDTVINPTPRGAEEVTAPSLALYGSYRFPTGRRVEWGIAAAMRLHFDGRSFSPLAFGSVDLQPAIGAWCTIAGVAHIRLGARQFQLFHQWEKRRTLIFTPSAGVGVSAYGVRIDYSFSAPLTGISTRFTHLVSLGISLKRRFQHEPKLGGSDIELQHPL